jgi:uncharacterized OB-fold protein
MSPDTKPLPQTDGPNAPYWAAARRGELVLQRCLDCGAWRFPAARICAACSGERAEWQRASGRASLESWCVFHKAYFPGFETPYLVAQVKLAEGVQLFTNLVDTPESEIAIGMALEIRFEPVNDEVSLVKFAAAGRAP